MGGSWERGDSAAPILPPLTCPLQLPVAVQLPLCLSPVAAVSPQGSLVLRHHSGAWDRSGGSGVTSLSLPAAGRDPQRLSGSGTMPCTWISGNEEQQAGASPPRVWGMPSPAEPVKPVSQPSRASRSEMYSLWSRDGAVRGGCGCRRGAAPRGRGGLLPYHVGIRGGHDVGVGAVGPHGDPQRGQTRRRVGGRRWQVLVAQGDVLGLGGTPCRGSREQGGGAGRGSPVGPRSSPGCHSWWKEPVAPTVQHSLWARRHPGASGCSLGACWPFAPARNRTRQLRPSSPAPNASQPSFGDFAKPSVFSPRNSG